jgi:hypothetical protein
MWGAQDEELALFQNALQGSEAVVTNVWVGAEDPCTGPQEELA